MMLIRFISAVEITHFARKVTAWVVEIKVEVKLKSKNSVSSQSHLS